MKKFLCFSLLCLLLTGCATTPPPSALPVRVERAPQVKDRDLQIYNAAMRTKEDLEHPDLKLFHLANQFYNAGNFLLAANEFEKYINNYPQSARREEALFKLGDCYFKVNANEKALKLTRRFLTRYSRSRFRPLINERLGLLDFRRGFYQDARRALKPLLPTADDPDYVQYALAVSLDNLGLIKEAFDYYYDIYQRNPERDFTIRCSERIDELLVNDFKVNELEVFILSDKYPKITDRLLFTLGISYFQRENYQAADRAFEQFIERYPWHKKTQKAYDWLKLIKEKSIPQPLAPPPIMVSPVEKNDALESLSASLAPGREQQEDVTRDTIILFAPVSGRFAKYGQEVENGVRFALDDLLDKGKTPLKLVVMDTEGDKFLARKLAEKAAETPNILLGIGGLFSHTTKVIAQTFEKAGIPLLSPTASETSFTYNTRNIFASAFNNFYQAESLADYAVKKRGLTNLAVLYPDNSLGIELANLFKAKVEELGATVSAFESYKTTDTDFQDQVYKIKLKKPEAVFIPDKLERVRLVLPQFTLYRFQPLYLGSNGWQSPALKQIAASNLPEVVFPVAFFSASRRPLVRNFIDNYWERYSIAPDTMAALAYDLTNLFVLEYKKGNQTRETISLSLSKVRGFAGISGEILEFRGGLARKRTILVQYKRGYWQEIN